MRGSRPAHRRAGAPGIAGSTGSSPVAGCPGTSTRAPAIRVFFLFSVRRHPF